ncbi:H-2 class II histocompatibility antigen, I-E beta chain-like [Denticeps clupeoides]|uniref:Ig-like domain-containing protein n=1 Tax=Denticeps clupeoides TaxID=299321 RepID=A0AAY4D0R0_9TELE|nr:H-2 class II histocompatibility antigen, I-E beta chain-like [Denticeps clupeoides]
MFPLKIAISLTAVLSFYSGIDGYFYSRVNMCLSSSSDLTDLEFIDTYIFNKQPYIQFNSTVNKYVGFTEHGVYNAERWNSDPAILGQEQAEKDRYCRHNQEIFYENVWSKTEEPKIKLVSVKAPSGQQPAVLMCSAYNFYPKLIKVTWYRDGKQGTGTVTSTQEMADGNWFYQVHSRLEYFPKSGEKISCVVEHASLKEPKETFWDPSASQSETNKIAIGAAGLVLGVIVSAAGFIYYKRKARGRILVPTS